MQSSSYLIVDPHKSFLLKPHPDNYTVDTTTGYGIDELRKAITWTQQKPFSKEVQVLLISEVERCSIEGQNALLKLVEEPPQSTRIILTTRSYQKILRTIRSRCTIGDVELLKNDEQLRNEIILQEIPEVGERLTIPSTPQEAYTLSEALSQQSRNELLDTLDTWIGELYVNDAEGNYRIIDEMTRAKEAIFHNGNIPLALDLLFAKLQTNKLSESKQT